MRCDVLVFVGLQMDSLFAKVAALVVHGPEMKKVKYNSFTHMICILVLICQIISYSSKVAVRMTALESQYESSLQLFLVKI